MADQPSPFSGGNIPLLAEGAVYLGNFDAVQMIVREYISDVSNAVADGNAMAILELADRQSLRFAGQEPGYEPIPGWAVRSELGLYVAKHCMVEADESLVEILRALFLKIAVMTMDLIKESDQLREDIIQFRIDVMVEEAAAALTGTWEVVYPPDEE